jgi:hypothetical protein
MKKRSRSYNSNVRWFSSIWAKIVGICVVIAGIVAFLANATTLHEWIIKWFFPKQQIESTSQVISSTPEQKDDTTHLIRPLNQAGKIPPERKTGANIKSDKSASQTTYSDSTIEKRYDSLFVDLPPYLSVTICVDDSSYGSQKNIVLPYGNHKIKIKSEYGIVEREITIPDKKFLPVSKYDFQKQKE